MSANPDSTDHEGPAAMPCVRSTAFEGVDYDDASQTLLLTLRKGGCFRYLGVPRHVYEAFRVCQSKGRFFAFRIKGHYPEASVS